MWSCKKGRIQDDCIRRDIDVAQIEEKMTKVGEDVLDANKFTGSISEESRFHGL